VETQLSHPDTSPAKWFIFQRSSTMLSCESIHELRSHWLPNIADAGLDRLIDLLEKSSPLLIHGCFTKTVPMGCLASQIAWNHPRTAHLMQEAGITWLHTVAKLNPATSQVLREWDRRRPGDFELRAELLSYLKEERRSRQSSPSAAVRSTEPVGVPAG
jgi:hypothetical protein